MAKKSENPLINLAVGLGITVGGNLLTDAITLLKSTQVSIIDVGEFDNTYSNINTIIYNMDRAKYEKHRVPTVSKDTYELNCDTAYMLKLANKNYLRVEAYRDSKANKLYNEQRIKLTFFGSQKYQYRMKMLKDAARLTDRKHIRVQYLSGTEFSCDVIPHRFDKIVLNENVKNRITNGLLSWANSKKWYEDHELVHKIGLLLHGQPGTGKSTIVKCVSSMFGNAPILTIDGTDIVNSIRSIIKMRKQYEGTIIVLIEDFDMYFKSREELYCTELDVDRIIQKHDNQNALFQLLDGMYSTDNTIYIATTNHVDRIDPALIRYGRFDIQEELTYFAYHDALRYVNLFGYDHNMLNDLNTVYPIQPARLQSKIMEYRAKNINMA